MPTFLFLDNPYVFVPYSVCGAIAKACLSQQTTGSMLYVGTPVYPTLYCGACRFLYPPVWRSSIAHSIARLATCLAPVAFCNRPFGAPPLAYSIASLATCLAARLAACLIACLATGLAARGVPHSVLAPFSTIDAGFKWLVAHYPFNIIPTFYIRHTLLRIANNCTVASITSTLASW